MRPTALLLLPFAVCAAPLAAQTDLPAVPSPAPAASLAAALSNASPPEDGPAIAVSADEVPLPPDATFPPKGTPAAEVAATYRQLAQPFGSVLAIAPPTMVVLKNDLPLPDPYQGLPPYTVLRVLLASLTPPQWAAITSQQGLGMADLDQPQQAMFQSLFPPGVLLPETGPYAGDPLPNLSAVQILQSRLRLPQVTVASFPDAADPARLDGGGLLTKLGAVSGYGTRATPGTIRALEASPADRMPLTDVVPNSPKPGNLDYAADRFQVALPLQDLKTVGELVSRIGDRTRTELYADPRLETRTFTVVGAGRTALASDVLQALAFCVTGTYRRVGPAYVLTDDVPGIGTRRQALDDILASYKDFRGELGRQADSYLATHPIPSLPYRSDSLQINSDEMKYAVPGNSEWGVALRIPFDALPPDQQQSVQAQFQRLQDIVSNSGANPSAAGQPTLEKPLEISTQPSVQLVVPGLDRPVNLSDAVFLPEELSNADLTFFRAESPPAAPPSARDLLMRYPHRALEAAPGTLAEIDAILAAMKRANFNELWLILPRPGDLQRAEGGHASARDLVVHALTAAQGSGIAVLPVMDLFQWRVGAPVDALDYNILGETSTQVHAREADMVNRQLAAEGKKPFPSADPSWVSVSPFRPTVVGRLRQQVNEAAQPGIAGLVWDATAPEGYDESASMLRGTPADEDMGYAGEGRLEFLRRYHADPIDLVFPHRNSLNLLLPYFRDAGQNRQLWEEWVQFRNDADLAALQQLYATVLTSAAGLGAGAPGSGPGGGDQGLQVLTSDGLGFAPWQDKHQLPGHDLRVVIYEGGVRTAPVDTYFSTGWSAAGASAVARELSEHLGAPGVVLSLSPARMDAATFQLQLAELVRGIG